MYIIIFYGFSHSNLSKFFSTLSSLVIGLLTARGLVDHTTRILSPILRSLSFSLPRHLGKIELSDANVNPLQCNLFTQRLYPGNKNAKYVAIHVMCTIDPPCVLNIVLSPYQHRPLFIDTNSEQFLHTLYYISHTRETSLSAT